MTPAVEPSRVSGRAVLIFTGGFVAWLFTTSVVVFGLHRLLMRTPPPPRLPIPPAPRLQVDPQVDATIFRAREDAWLHRYGWVDRARGIVHVPLQKAVELYVSGNAPQAAPATALPAGGRAPGAWEGGDR